MQEILLPDILDGTVISKNDTLALFKQLCDFTKYIIPESYRSMTIQKPSLPEEIPFDTLLEILQSNESLTVFLRTYYEYKSRPHKNYVVAKTLKDAFANTKIDIKGKYLPKSFLAYLEIRGLTDNDGDEIKGVFARIEEDALSIAMITYNQESKGYSAAHFTSDLPKEEESIADKIRSYPYVEVGTNLKNKSRSEIEQMLQTDDASIEITELVPEYHKHIHIIFNSILYITHCPELKEEINVFSSKKSKREGELKSYTQKPYIFVGRNFQMPRIYCKEEILVSGHWRWQPHGPERQLLKHIYIEPYLKGVKD